MKDINKVINSSADEFYIDNEYSNQQTPPSTPLRNAYNTNNHNNNKPVQRIIVDDENLKEKIGEAEISSKKTLKYVLDITIAYPDGEPLDLPNIVTGMRRSCQTHLLYRLYRCSEVSSTMSRLSGRGTNEIFFQVPREDEALTKWLIDRFTEKEELLENFYTTGSFAYPAEIQPTVVHQDLLRFFLIHLFFITSSYLHFQMITMLSNQLL